MKRVFISMFIALMAITTVQAQQIAVVTGSTTKMYQTLAEAIGGASNGSVIYLPGGGFQISDDVKITKKVTIIGIGHKAVSENADGNTVISGNLFFNEGSDGSAVMGCYISGHVLVGYDNTSVNNILVKLCNLNHVNVYSPKCTGTIVNQNYIRDYSFFGFASGEFTNNVAHSVCNLNGGEISYNIFLGSYYNSRTTLGILCDCNNCTISNNIFAYNRTDTESSESPSSCDNCITSNNMALNYEWGDDPINLDASSWDDVFENYNNRTISPTSNYSFKKNYKQYDNQVGIYGGTGFAPNALPPVPYIVNKNIDPQTDAAGMLKIQVRVKAGE